VSHAQFSPGPQSVTCSLYFLQEESEESQIGTTAFVNQFQTGALAMKEEGKTLSKETRIHWLDNLRTFMIFLVVLLHAGLVYESSGITAFFWIVDDPSTNHLSGILNLMLDLFVMPTIFFISGFFVVRSTRSRGACIFLKSKCKRLLLPWLIAVFTLIPLYKVIFLYSRNLPQEHWTTYFHWTNEIWGQNWLWFLPVLFLFNALYLILSKKGISLAGVRLKKAVWALFLAALFYGLILNLLNLQGWTKTLLIDFQNERILIYFMLFLLGAACYERRTFESETGITRLYVCVAVTAWIPVGLYSLLVIHSLIDPGAYLISRTSDILLIQISFLLSMFCLVYLVLGTFRRFMTKPSAWGAKLSQNSYGVYVLHVIVMGGIAVALMDSSIPSVLRHLILAVSTYLLSHAMVSLYRNARTAWTKPLHASAHRRLTHGELSG
jgi:surface polysaccharide O-acyltransferase-like enzyme